MATISRLSIDLVANSAKFRKDLDKASKSSKKFFGGVEKQAKQSIMLMGTLGASAAAAFSAKAVQTAGKFNEAMKDVQAKSQATDAQIKALSGTMRQLAKETKFTATQTAEAGTFLAMAGLNIKEINEAVAPTLAIAAATRTSVQQSADIMTNIMRGMNMTTSELSHASDVLSLTTASSNTNLIELGEAFKYAGPLANEMGMSVEQTAAMLGQMANAGLKGSIAGTAVRQSFVSLANKGAVLSSELANATGVMTKQERALKRLGVSTVDGEGNIRNLIDIMHELRAAGASSTDIVQIFGARASTALVPLMRPGALENVTGLADKLRDAQGSAERMSALQMDNFIGDTLLLKSQFEEIQMIFAEGGLTDFARKTFQGITDSMRNAEPFIRKLGENFHAVAGAITAFFVPALFMAIPAITALGKAILTNPLFLIGTALATATFLIISNMERIKFEAKKLQDNMKIVGDNVAGNFSTAFSNLVSVTFPKLITGIQLFFAKANLQLMKAINQIVTWFAKKVNSLIEIYNGIPFLDDTNLVEFQIDTTNATSKINELEAKLKNIEDKRKVFEMNTNFNTDTFVAPEVDTENPNIFGDSTGTSTDDLEDKAAEMQSFWEELKGQQTKYYSEVQQMSKGSWTNLISEGSKGSRKLAMINQGLAIKDVIISTQQAVMKAYASAPFPGNVVPVAKAVAAGGIALNNIKGQFHDGIDNVPDTGTYLLEKGERVVDNRLNKDLSQFLNTQQPANVTNNPTLNFNVSGGNADEVEEMLRMHRGKFESMIRDIYQENAQNAPF